MICSRCGGEKTDRLFRVHRGLVVALYVAGLGFAWTLGGSFLHYLIEGNDRSRLPLWQVGVPLACVLGAVGAGLLRTRRAVCERCGPVDVPAWLTPLSRARSDRILGRGLTRRVFLRSLGAGGAAVAGSVTGLAVAIGRNRAWIPVARDFFSAKVEETSPHPRPEWTAARIRSYRRLGRTNAMVSDISLGAGRIHDASIAERAVERGLTYFDTAPDYSHAASERTLGEVISRTRRDQLFLATKFCREDGHLRSDTPVPEVIAAVEASLQRLRTDYVDLVHIHSCDQVDRLLAPNIHEAFDRLKEQGKARFLGVSTHTPNLEAVANAAIDSGRFDVMMLAYHFGMWPSFEHILQKAKAHDVGVVAMKTLKGAKHQDLSAFRDEKTAYSHAAFRWVLSNPAVSCLVVSFYDPQHVDEYLAASGTELRPQDVALLRRYDQQVAGDYCQPHCGECLGSCPHDLPINDVLRYRMYARDYHWPEEGQRHYARLASDASLCIGCPAPCAGTCPLGVPIREKMLDAHRRLLMPT